MGEGGTISEAQAADSPLRERLHAISDALSSLYSECYGKGPLEARTTVAGDTVVCVLRGTSTSMEQNLFGEDQAEDAASYRHHLHDALKPRMAGIVEDALECAVRSVMSASDPREDVDVQVFVLDRDGLAARVRHVRE